MTGSFLTAGYLINDVYASWSESPTISSVKTFPIAELKFPDITICPPKHTYTSLGYDLKKINRLTLGTEGRKRLQNLAVSQIHLHEHENYLKTVAPLFSSEAISQLYSGQREVTLLSKILKDYGGGNDFAIG